MRLRSLPIKDVRNIAMSLVIAVAVWVYAHSSSLATKTSTVRLNIVAKSGWVVTRVRAPSGREIPVTPADAAAPLGLDTHVFSVSVDAVIQYPRRSEDVVQEAIRGGKIFGEVTVVAPDDGEEREIAVTLFPTDFRSPSGLGATVIKVITGQLNVTIAQEETRQDVPVEAVVVGTPPGTRVDMKWPSPDRVAITGPRSVVDRLERIRTEPIDISDREPRLGVQIPVSTKIDEKVIIDGVERRIRCNTPVECVIYLAPQPVEREFESLPVLLLSEPDFRDEVKFVSQQDLTVRVSGSPAAIEKLRKEDILLFIDVRDLDRTPERKQYVKVRWKILNWPPGEPVSVQEPEQVVVVVTPRTAPRP